MKIQFWAVGKENEAYIKNGVAAYTHRIARYHKVEWVIIPVPKHAGMMSEMDLRKKEGDMILEWLKKPGSLNRAGQNDYVVALDAKGTQLDSEGFAGFMQKTINQGIKNLVFVIGGAFGLDRKVLDRADFVWSLSHLTFPHQLVRLILAEQVYRACTILKNEKYHHK